MFDHMKRSPGFFIFAIIALPLLMNTLLKPSPQTEPAPVKANQKETLENMRRVGDALAVKRHPDGGVEAWVAQEARRVVPKLTYKNGEDCTMPGAPGSLMLPVAQNGNISFVDKCTGQTISISPENVTIKQSGNFSLCDTAKEMTTVKGFAAGRPKSAPAQPAFEKRAPGK